MRHVTLNTPSPASVTTYVPGATSLWWVLLLATGGLLILSAAVIIKQTPRLRDSRAAALMAVSGFVTMIYAGTGFSAPQYEQLHPSASSVAAKLGLSPVAGSDNSFRDASGHRYDGCSANSKKIDDHHVSSTLLCTLDGKPVFAPHDTSS